MKYYALIARLIIFLYLTQYGIRLILSGAKGLAGRRPVYTRNKPQRIIDMLGYFLIWFLVYSIGFIRLTATANSETSLEWNPAGIFLAVLVAGMMTLYIGIRGRRAAASYAVAGLDRRVLEVIEDALERSGIAYREQFEDYDLVGLQSTIYTSISGGIGFAGMRIEPEENMPILDRVVENMKRHTEENGELFRPLPMILLMVLGILVILIGAITSYLFFV
jgi:hypothetical protein